MNHRFPLMTPHSGGVKDVWAAVRGTQAPPGGHTWRWGGLLRREETELAPSHTSVERQFWGFFLEKR